MRVTISKKTTDNLCDNCLKEFATCKQAHIKFGNGIGNDNVIECSEYIITNDSKD